MVMETPKTSIVNIYSAGIENTLQNQVFMNSVKSILDMAYVKSLREDEGGTYGASVQAELGRHRRSTCQQGTHSDATKAWHQHKSRAGTSLAMCSEVVR